MRRYVAPSTEVVLVGVKHPLLGITFGDGEPVVTSGGISYPGGPGGSFDPDEEIAVRRFNVWDDDWSAQ